MIKSPSTVLKSKRTSTTYMFVRVATRALPQRLLLFESQQ